MDFPTIFEWLERLSFLRGEMAAAMVLLTAVVMLVIPDWRVMLFALAAQYLFAGLLFVDVLDPRLAIIKILTGWFVTLILYISARQVDWNKTSGSVEQEKFISVRGHQLPGTTLLRIGLTVGMVLVVQFLARKTAVAIIPAHLDHFQLAVYALIGLGLLGMVLASEPLRIGLGIFTFLTGFELIYSAVEQSTAVLALLAAVNLALAVTISYLMQARQPLPHKNGEEE